MNDLKPPAQSMVGAMSERQLEGLAARPTQGKPKHQHGS
ncbi:DUF3008 family protein [Burkholderia sp. Bp8963]